MPELRIIVRGANDIGSAIAHRLFMTGYFVAVHEVSQPTTTRRKMSFTDAVFDERSVLEGVESRLILGSNLPQNLWASHHFIPIFVGEFDQLLKTIQPHILIDARMRKHLRPETQRGLAKLTIGLGPNFVAGDTTDLAIETKWGSSLGQIIEHGATQSLQGEPREIAGHARDRYVYAPITGIFRTSLQIGEAIKQGQEVARVDSTLLFAPITGILRGLTRDGVLVSRKIKVIEVDPRTETSQVTGIGERPARIAKGVISAIKNWEIDHVH